MSGWHSLSGYLHYKCGSNAIGRLITRRRVWCILEESQCELQYYKTENDVYKHKSPQGHIGISGAAISLDLEHQNQFVILSSGKEHIFTAENHESMMIWLLGLQAKRDVHAKKLTAPHHVETEDKPDKPRSHSEAYIWSARPRFFLTPEQQNDSLCAGQMPADKRKLRCIKSDLQKWGESVDSGMGLYRMKLEARKSLPLQASLSRRPGDYHKRYSITPLAAVPRSDTILHSDSSSADSDDVFSEEMKLHGGGVSNNWRKVQSRVMAQVLTGSRLPVETNTEAVDRYSLSSRSASSDSAIDKGESTPQELSCRLGELERDLIVTKCELAKVLNRQTCYQELLQHQEETIKELQGGDASNPAYNAVDVGNRSEKNASGLRASGKTTKAGKDSQEKVRVLQNQNRFLNEEVKKLARIRLQEHGKYQEQQLKVQSLEADIDKWKLDFVMLIQSSIRAPAGDSIEDLELNLYGGDKHKKRVQRLLDEARKTNPGLPTYDSLANNEVHVDKYGFKHVYTNTGLLLHYLCTELTHHYLVQAGLYEDHQKHWTLYMRQHGKNPMICPKELKLLCRGGIPDRFRTQVWRHLVHYKVRDIMHNKGDHYYRNLCNMLPESPLAACYRKQVSLDLMRTMPNNVKFTIPGSKGIMDLQDVLLAFCVHNPTIGYCQGMNFIVSMSLVFMDAQDAFWTLVAVTERFFSPHYFDHSLIGAQSDQRVLKDMVRDKLPELSAHLNDLDIELSTVTLNWFLAVFFDAVPFQTLLRVWDCFLLEGPKVLFRFALAILRLHERDILLKTDTMAIMKHLKACAKLTYDVEGLVQLAFQGLRPFPKRRDILSKETCYLNALKEKHKKKELQRLAFAEREQLYMNMEAESGMFMGIECAVALHDGKVWFCYGDQHIGRLSCVSCDLGTMSSIDFKLDSRLMCVSPLGEDHIVMGTISWILLSLSLVTRQPVWQLQLHDAILSVCCYDDEDSTATRIFSGLADGTVAVTEQQYNKVEPSMDVIYIPIGQAPVTCLLLLGDQLWCASGNTVAIIHAKTLDAMDVFSVSVNPYDHILSVVPGDFGIWISLRGSSILELWDPQTLNCRMLYDTRMDRYPQLRKEDDTYFNRSRITSTLANGNTVWVGTGEGNLIIYEVRERVEYPSTNPSPPTYELSSAHHTVVAPDSFHDMTAGKVAYHIKKVTDLSEMFTTSSGTTVDSTDLRTVIHNVDVERSNTGSNKHSVKKTNIKLDRQLSASAGDLVNLCKDKDNCEDVCEIVVSGFEENLEAEARRYSSSMLLDSTTSVQLEAVYETVRARSTKLAAPMERKTSSSETELDQLKKVRGESVDGEDSGDLEDPFEQALEVDACISSYIYKAHKPSHDNVGDDVYEQRLEEEACCAGHVRAEIESNVHEIFEEKLEKDARKKSLTSVEMGHCVHGAYRESLNDLSEDETNHDAEMESKVQELLKTSLETEAKCEMAVRCPDTFFQPYDTSNSAASSALPSPHGRSLSNIHGQATESPTFSFPNTDSNSHCLYGNTNYGNSGQYVINGNTCSTSSECEQSCDSPNSIDDTGSVKKFKGDRNFTKQNGLGTVLQKSMFEEQDIVVNHLDPGSQTISCEPIMQTKQATGQKLKLVRDDASSINSKTEHLNSNSTGDFRRKYSEHHYEQIGNYADWISQSGSEKGMDAVVTRKPSQNRPELGRREKVGCWLSSLSNSEEQKQSDDDSRHRNRTRSDSKFFRRVNGKSAEKTDVKITINRHDNLETMATTGSLTHRPAQCPALGKDVGSSGPYRLDFSNLQVETDQDSHSDSNRTPTQPVDDDNDNNITRKPRITDGHSDNRKRSLDIGSIQEKCIEYETNHTSTTKDSPSGESETADRVRLFELLKTPSLATRHMSLGLQTIDTESQWSEIPGSQMSTNSPTTSAEQRLVDFLKTPTISSRPSSLWSSYENISSPSQPGGEYKLSQRLSQHILSHSASTVSIPSEDGAIYNIDLHLEAKVKISDKPVKCLLATSCNNEPVILSFSGSHGDDEAVLKWRKHKNEQLWTNEPILELCPRTKTAILPSYMKRRQSSTSSYLSQSSADSALACTTSTSNI